MYAIVKSCQNFFITFMVVMMLKTDHRPLIFINNKLMSQSPAGLQRIFVQIQNYDWES